MAGVYLHTLRDAETGSAWNLNGEAVAGPPAGNRPARLLNFNAMWCSYRVSFPFATTFEATGKRGSVLYE